MAGVIYLEGNQMAIAKIQDICVCREGLQNGHCILSKAKKLDKCTSCHCCPKCFFLPRAILLKKNKTHLKITNLHSQIMLNNPRMLWVEWELQNSSSVTTLLSAKSDPSARDAENQLLFEPKFLIYTVSGFFFHAYELRKISIQPSYRYSGLSYI